MNASHVTHACRAVLAISVGVIVVLGLWALVLLACWEIAMWAQS